MRILLVEDETDLGKAIKQVLVSQKYVVDWVTDDVIAWSYLESQWTDYSVVIVDWLIPKLSAPMFMLRGQGFRLKGSNFQHKAQSLILKGRNFSLNKFNFELN